MKRVDPPSWWIGFEDPQVELMVHAPGAAEWSASVDHAGVRVVSTTRLESPNYLFVTLEIAPTAQPGDIPLLFKRGSRTVARHAWPLQQRAPGSRERKGFGNGDAIYLITPDRFANGDAANDAPAGSLDRVDRSDGGARHGGDLRGIEQQLDYIAGLGFTQIWMSPVLENAQPAYSYHGYALTDAYAIDPRYGTREQYRELSRQARARGIGLINDVVTNHVGDRHWWMADLPSSRWVNGLGKRPFTNHVHTTVQDPYAVKGDRSGYADGWFDTAMPDLNQREPQLATYLIQNALWWIEYADLSGTRVDTYSYSDRDFMSRFSERIMREYPGFNIVGEEWHNDPIVVSYWQRGKVNSDGYVSHLPTVMDFPLESTLGRILKEKDGFNTGFRSLYERLSTDFVYADPMAILVFADNHDMDRIHTRLGRDTGLTKIALATIATMRGIPQVYYGTEVMIANDRPGDHGDIRRDFPGGWAGDATNGFAGTGLTAEQREMQQYVRTLFTWRRTSQAAATGRLQHYTPEQETYVYFRLHERERVMVVLNKNEQPVTLDLRRFRPSLGDSAHGTNVLTGENVVLGEALVVPPRAATIIDIRETQP